MYCPTCKAPNPAWNKTCSECGTPISSPKFKGFSPTTILVFSILGLAFSTWASQGIIHDMATQSPRGSSGALGGMVSMFFLSLGGIVRYLKHRKSKP